MAVERADRDRLAGDDVVAVASPYLPVTVSSDEIQFRAGPWSGPVVSLTDEDGDGQLGALASLLDGSYRLTEILDRFQEDQRAELDRAIDGLYEDGVLVEVEPDYPPRYRGYRAADPTIDGSGPPIAGTVLIVATGRIGPMVAADLSRLSFDRVSILPRPVRGNDDAPAVADAAVERLPSDTAIDAAIEGVEYVVYTTDGPDSGLGRRVNRLAYEQGTPSISARLLGLDGQIGPTVLPGQSACYECFHRRARATMAPEYRRGSGDIAPSRVPPLTAHARILAGWLVTDLLRLAGAGTGYTVGGTIHFDFFDMTVEPNPVLKLPRCPTCGVADRRRVDVKRFVDHDRLLEKDR